MRSRSLIVPAALVGIMLALVLGWNLGASATTTNAKDSPGFLSRSENWLGLDTTLVAEAMIGYVPETDSRIWSVNRINKEGKVDGSWCAHEVRAKGEPFLQSGDPVRMTSVSYGLTGKFRDRKTIYFVSRKERP